MVEFDQYTVDENGIFLMYGRVKGSLSPTPVENQVFKKLVELKKELVFLTNPKVADVVSLGPDRRIVVKAEVRVKTEEDHEHERILTFIANLSEI